MSFLRVPNYHVSSLRVNCTNIFKLYHYQIPEKEPITRPRRIVVERTLDLQPLNGVTRHAVGRGDWPQL